MKYDVPTQVLFFDGEDISIGIAFGEYVICACCGGVFELDKVKITKELSWVDFSDYINF